MAVLPRLRDGGVYYGVLIGCLVTTCYLLLFTQVTNDAKEDWQAVNISRMNYEYEEVCREWKQALDQNNRSVSNDSSIERHFEAQTWEETIDLDSHFHCDTSFRRPSIDQRGQYYVLYNFVKASEQFECTESVTLTAPADYRFLDNVPPLVERWRGPISIALYAPGHDFYTTLRSIAYLRNCGSNLIERYVTFHIFFDQEHTPNKENGANILDAYSDIYDCSRSAPFTDVNDTDLYKTQNGLLYPINTARNVAKLAATTYFVFPSDIELYPTKNFIGSYLKFVQNNIDLFQPNSRNVFVLPIFEVLESQEVPENKTALLLMLKQKTAIIFHQSVCIVCHRVIDSEKWAQAQQTEGLGVFSTGKRHGRYQVWEPFYVCTQNEPLWDERMTWEGQNNKMVQAYTMCLMDYDFVVLDNAFLIHKPGVKKKKVQLEKFGNVVRNSTQMIRKIAVELQQFYGKNDNCSLKYFVSKVRAQAKQKSLAKVRKV